MCASNTNRFAAWASADRVRPRWPETYRPRARQGTRAVPAIVGAPLAASFTAVAFTVMVQAATLLSVQLLTLNVKLAGSSTYWQPAWHLQAQ